MGKPMTEDEWLTCEGTPARMVRELVAMSRGRLPGSVRRKLRLLACFGCHRLLELSRAASPDVSGAATAATAVARAWADGSPSGERYGAASRSVQALLRGARDRGEDPPYLLLAAEAVLERQALKAAVDVLNCGYWSTDAFGEFGLEPEADYLAERCRAVRDLFGNPYRPAAFDPAWRTRCDGTAEKLARSVYEEGAFDRLPVLADALEDAGCAAPDVLGHCRGGGLHVRGCWVVDLLLGRG